MDAFIVLERGVYFECAGMERNAGFGLISLGTFSFVCEKREAAVIAVSAFIMVFVVVHSGNDRRSEIMNGSRTLYVRPLRLGAVYYFVNGTIKEDKYNFHFF